jgi:hypothetical protein
MHSIEFRLERFYCFFLFFCFLFLVTNMYGCLFENKIIIIIIIDIRLIIDWETLQERPDKCQTMDVLFVTITTTHNNIRNDSYKIGVDLLHNKRETKSIYSESWLSRTLNKAKSCRNRTLLNQVMFYCHYTDIVNFPVSKN